MCRVSSGSSERPGRCQQSPLRKKTYTCYSGVCDDKTKERGEPEKKNVKKAKKAKKAKN